MFNNISSNYFWRFPPSIFTFVLFFFFVSMCFWYRHIFLYSFLTGVTRRESDGCGIWSIVYWWCFTCCHFFSFSTSLIEGHVNINLCWISNLIFASEKWVKTAKATKFLFFGYQVSNLTYWNSLFWWSSKGSQFLMQ